MVVRTRELWRLRRAYVNLLRAQRPPAVLRVSRAIFAVLPTRCSTRPSHLAAATKNGGARLRAPAAPAAGYIQQAIDFRGYFLVFTRPGIAVAHCVVHASAAFALGLIGTEAKAENRCAQKACKPASISLWLVREHVRRDADRYQPRPFSKRNCRIYELQRIRTTQAHKLRWIGTALALALAWMPARADIDIFIKPVLTLEVVQRIGGAAMTAAD